MAKVLARALLPLREPRGGCLSSTVVLSMRPFPVPPARPLARNDDVGAQSLLCRVGSLQPSQEDGPVLVVPCHRADGTRPTPFYSILDSANQLSLPSLTLALSSPRTFARLWNLLCPRFSSSRSFPSVPCAIFPRHALLLIGNVNSGFREVGFSRGFFFFFFFLSFLRLASMKKLTKRWRDVFFRKIRRKFFV